MPDITMCLSKNCPEKENCYRARAKPDRWQSYSDFEILCHKDNGFPDFMPIFKDGILEKQKEVQSESN